jgi:hypothetical protein
VRLAGGTGGEVRLFAGLEAGLASRVGIILAIPLFFELRPLLAAGVIMGIKLYPTDLAPPIPMAIGPLVYNPSSPRPQVLRVNLLEPAPVERVFLSSRASHVDEEVPP